MGFRGLAGDGGRGALSKGAAGHSKIKGRVSVWCMSLFFLIFSASSAIARAVGATRKASQINPPGAVAHIDPSGHDEP